LPFSAMLKIAYADIYPHPLPAKHRFPMSKYGLIRDQLLYEGTASTSNFFVPGLLAEEDILRTHQMHYWRKLKDQNLSRAEERRTGFPLSPQLVERERCINQGTIENCRFALQYGISMNVAGGTHHAYADRGEGFCLLNDMAIAAHWLLERKLARKILIVDLDVHQGNGTAAIMQNESRVYTFSMHGAGNYPLRKERSDWDEALPDGCDDQTYLRRLQSILPRLIDEQQPDFLFYQSGVDVLASDKLGRLSLSMEGCRQRDQFVLETAKREALPTVVAMGGGYSPRVADVVTAHVNTFRLAQEIFF